MTPHDPAEVDRRFRELMQAEFAQESTWSVNPPPAAPVEPTPGGSADVPLATGPRVLPFNAGRVDDDDNEFDLERFDDLSYRDVEDSGHRWSTTSLVGFLLLGGGLAGMLAMIFGVTLGAPWAQLALVATIAGLGLMLVQALRGDGHEDASDNGARL